MQNSLKKEPIALVGHSCILPGCDTPEALWQAVQAGQTKITPVSADYWRIKPEKVLATGKKITGDQAYCSEGGYVSNFNWDPDKFSMDNDYLNRLDPLFKWSLQAAYLAIKDLISLNQQTRNQTSVILGNLSYPNPSHTKLYEETILHNLLPDYFKTPSDIHPDNRYGSSLPAQLIAKNLGFSGDAFCLDAACASSLYAVKMACDQLHSGKSKLVLAGGINAADSLFLHVGFSALNALSPSGQSRPFHKEADGLIPAEGVAFLALKRLSDALEDGDEILGLVQGVGLSNDGRDGGFLTPSVEGQETCIRSAYSKNGIDPKTISYIECHATGTATGDSREIDSMKNVFGANTALPVGSLKGILGHLITASGAASIVKVLQAFKNKTLPYAVPCSAVTASFEDSGFYFPEKNTPWNEQQHPRRAAINGFGFGGNNAHIILEEWNPEQFPQQHQYTRIKNKQKSASGVALVAIEFSYGGLKNENELFAFLNNPQYTSAGKDKVLLNAKNMGFPPKDLEQSIGQQTLLLQLLENNDDLVTKLNADKTAVFIGMEVDSECSRGSLRLHLQEHFEHNKLATDETTLEQLKDDIFPPLNSAIVIGCMPNICANRINNKYNFREQGLTFSGEKLSTNYALDYAFECIQNNEIESAIVGAAEIGDEALQNSLQATGKNANAAIVWVLCNLDYAQKQSLPVLAELSQLPSQSDFQQTLSAYHDELQPLYNSFGSNRWVENLLESSLGIWKQQAGIHHINTPANPLLENDTHAVAVTPMVQAIPKTSGINLLKSHSDNREIALYSGPTLEDLIQNISNDHFANSDSTGDFRAGFYFDSEEKFNELKLQCLHHLNNTPHQQGWHGDYCRYSQPVKGELAFMFTGAASAYNGSASALLETYPLLAQALREQFNGSLENYCGWMYPDWSKDQTHNNAFNDLCGSSFVSQLHATISQKIWKLKADAGFGLSSGETNSVLAFGFWNDLPALIDEIWQSGLYQSELCNDYNTVADYWKLENNSKISWKSWVVFCDHSLIKALVDAEEKVYLTIISSPKECVIAGDEKACARLLQKIPDIQHIPLNHDLACHAPVLGSFTASWKKIHSRDVKTHAPVRLYSSYFAGQYSPDSEKIAEALTGQAAQTIDFPKIVRQVYDSGVRIFIEHGPRDSLCRSIKDILSEHELKNTLILPMDEFSKNACNTLYKNTIELWCSGQTISLENFKLKNNNKISKLGFDIRKPDIKFSSAVTQDTLRPIHDSADVTDAIQQKNQGNSNTTAALNSRTMPPAPKLRNLNASFNTSAKIQLESRETQQHNNLLADSRHSLLRHIMEQQTQIHTEYLQTQLENFQIYNHNLEKQIHTLIKPQPVNSTAASAAVQIKHNSNNPIQNIISTALTEEHAQADSTVKINKPKPEVIESTSANSYDYNPSGPAFSRHQLEILSSSKISSVLGKAFEAQDDYAIQVRMPEPPLLLCDRVTGIDAVAKSMQKGTIWTETDVTATSWYTHHGYMPAGIFIEAGQADLLLISYLGVDFKNKGKRAYRLLGCELEIFGDLPKVGDTLQYKICVDGHAQSGDVRLFFFHYDCYINGIKRIQVRNGQAGFFSHEELSEASGVLWHADNASYTTTAIPAPPVALSSTAYSPLQIKKYLNGDFVGCFGEDFFWTQTHTRTPTTATEKMNFIQEITEINSEGGPAGRGYLKATSRISPDDWYFEGHFKNDPCMPGTLMAEGCIQMMSFYLIALGYTLKSDGWRFQPATNSNYKFDCRGQVTPQSEELIYELFIDDIILDPHPTLYAHVLCTVDGRKAFLCERLGVELVPDWPLSEYLLNTTDTKLENCVEYNGFKFDYQSLLNCALGKPSNAFGDCYQIYDDGIRSSRLPGPPYHFMSRITELKAEFGNPYNQPSVTAEYTVSKDQWFFKENGSNSMPYCVLMEIALQPCGWLDSFCRDSEIAGEELLYRNLDGFNAIQHIELPQADYTFTTKVNMVSASRTASLIINRFKVETFANDKLAYSYETAFGFFPLESMANQRGLKISQTDQLLYEQASNIDITLTSHPLEYFNRTGPSLPKSKLLMLDRIVYFDQEGGENKKGYMRCEKDVNPKDWFFKAHFFQDPVQPGSLGVEAILQLMQLYMLKRHPEYCQSGMQFEPIIIGEAIEWHYRGQVTPEKELISVDIEVTEETDDKNSYLLWARAKLWVDGLKIYELPKIGMRLKNSAASDRVKYSHWKIDSVTSPWVLDHCPTYCRPSLPFTYLIELACSATECNLDRHGIHFDNIEIKTWMDFQTVVNPDSDSSYYEIEGEIKTTETSQHNFEFTVSKNQQHRSVFDSTTEALICGTGSYRFLDKSSPIRFPEASELKDIKASSLPYDNHEFFHGKSFQLLNKLEIGSNGSRAEIKTLSQEMQHDISGFAILDSVIQSIPNSNLSQWYPQLNTDLIAYPCQMHDLTLLESLVTENILKTESRFIEVINNRYIKIAVWIYNADRVIGYFVLTQVLVSKGITKAMTTEQRYDFIVRKIPLAEQKVLRKSPCGKSFSLEFDDIQSTDWLSGTLEAIYSLPDELSLKDKTRAILLKEYIASQKKCHPATVSLNYGLYKNADYLEQNFGIIINNRSTGLDLSSARAIAAVEFETKTIDIASLMTERGFRENLFNDLIVGLYEKFVDVIMFEDIDDFNNTGNAIYLANHQVAIESFLFAAQTYAIKGERLSTISKAENSEHWLGKIQKLAQDLYQDKNPLDILYFNRQSPDQLIDIVKQFIKNSKNSKKSLFVHAGGTREQYENQGIGQMSSFILDQAVENKTPVIPVLFLNGLPETDKGVKFELPYQLTKQTYLYGKSIQPEELKPLNAKERIEYFQQRLADLKSQYCSQKQATMNINNEQNHEIQHMAEQHDISLFAASCIYILLNKENASSETVDFINSMQGNVDKMVNNLPIL